MSGDSTDIGGCEAYLRSGQAKRIIREWSLFMEGGGGW